MSKPKSTPQSTDSKPFEPLGPAQRQAQAGLLVMLGRFLAGMGKELHEGSPSPEREAEILRILWGAATGIVGWDLVRFKRTQIIRAVKLTAALEASDAPTTVRIGASWVFAREVSNETIQRAVDAWNRAGKQRSKGASQPLKWPAMAALVAEAGLGNLDAESLRTEWQEWKKVSGDGDL